MARKLSYNVHYTNKQHVILWKESFWTNEQSLKHSSNSVRFC